MIDDASDSAHAHVAAALAVLAGIAASDAICGLRLGRYARGQDHLQAIQLLETVESLDRRLPGRLRRLIGAKDRAQYSPHLMTASDARALVHLAREIVDAADAL